MLRYPPDDGFVVTAVEFLEVQFCDAPGLMRPTAYEAIMERMVGQGHLLRFRVLVGSRLKKAHPLEAELMIGIAGMRAGSI